MDFQDHYSNLRLFTFPANLPDCLIFLEESKILLRQIRHSFPAWYQAIPDIRQTSQPDPSCSGKSGDQANKGHLWRSLLYTIQLKNTFYTIHYTLYTIHCNVHYKLYTVMYTINYALYAIHFKFTLYTIHSLLSM